jgi:flavin reductase (DIM6/NTAB) family NADH-FMN oxidoreductase RutF
MAKRIKPGSTALYPIPAVLVSCGQERPNIITLAWVGTVSSDPPAVSIAVRPERLSHSLIAEAGEFVVNLPYANQVDAVDYCGQVSGREVDKWAACRLTPVRATKIDTPLIAECPVALECRVTHQLTLGVHDLFIGQVLAVQVDEVILNHRGQVDYERAQFLAYAAGYYFRLGEQLGRFGDWRGGRG